MNAKSLVKDVVIVALLAAAGAANAAWFQGGVLVSNVCRAPSGAFWIYPAQYAQPVGTACAIFSTGEAGVVAPN